MNTTLIIAAHLDDFELGMGGTASKLCAKDNVHLLVLCKGDRPGHEKVGSPRKVACVNNCKDIGIHNVAFHDYSDTRLDQTSQTELCNLVYHHIQIIKPTTVYTHYPQASAACRHRAQRGSRSRSGIDGTSLILASTEPAHWRVLD